MRCTRSRTCACFFLLARFPFRLGDRGRYPTRSKMQFSIKHVLLLVLIWAVTIAVVPYAPWIQMRVTYYDSVAINEVRELQLVIISISDELPISLDRLRKSDQWLTIKQSVDAWGRPLQIIESNQKSIFGFDCGISVFSFGADGVSETSGNDPDDINSWDDHHYAFYHNQIRTREVIARLYQSFWLAPLLYFILIATNWVIRHVK